MLNNLILNVLKLVHFINMKFGRKIRFDQIGEFFCSGVKQVIYMYSEVHLFEFSNNTFLRIWIQFFYPDPGDILNAVLDTKPSSAN